MEDAAHHVRKTEELKKLSLLLKHLRYFNGILNMSGKLANPRRRCSIILEHALVPASNEYQIRWIEIVPQQILASQ